MFVFNMYIIIQANGSYVQLWGSYVVAVIIVITDYK